jgi:predicted nuclease of predicted toxin-antitoxin system
MSVAFYMDENVHRGITDGLRIRDVDVLTVQEDDRIGFSDPFILDRATELNRILFTQDDDFLTEANRRQQEKIYFTGVIYVHKLRISVGDCVHDLEIIAKLAYPDELANHIMSE